MVTLCDFALATAMRQDEICRLQNVFQWAYSRESSASVGSRSRSVRPAHKVGNDQTVPLLPATWAIVEPLVRDRSSGAVFPYNSASVSIAFTRACTALRIKDLHFHDLRHRATADLFRQGLDIPRVALMTGHKTWEQLRRYTAIKPEDVHAAMPKPKRVKPAAKAKDVPITAAS